MHDFSAKDAGSELAVVFVFDATDADDLARMQALLQVAERMAPERTIIADRIAALAAGISVMEMRLRERRAGAPSPQSGTGEGS